MENALRQLNEVREIGVACGAGDGYAGRRWRLLHAVPVVPGAHAGEEVLVFVVAAHQGASVFAEERIVGDVLQAQVGLVEDAPLEVTVRTADFVELRLHARVVAVEKQPVGGVYRELSR